jgi:hypothetical protein
MHQPGLPGSQFPSDDEIMRAIKALRSDMQQFTAANVLATAGIAPFDGGVMVKGKMHYQRADGTLGVAVDPATGTFTAYDAAGTSPVARFGELLETDPGAFGVEVDVGGTWVQLGAQAVTWDGVAGRPGIAGGATLPGSSINSAVASATTATTAAQADGNTTSAFNRDITGLVGSYKAVYMHSTNVFGYNTSHEKYKRNVRTISVDPADGTGFIITPDQLFALRGVIYDRKATDADDYTPPVSVDEIGMLAKETYGAVRELALKFDGEIDSVFYERLAVVLLPFVQKHEREISEVKADHAKEIAELKAAVRKLGGDI